MVNLNNNKETYFPTLIVNVTNNESKSAEIFASQWSNSICETEKSEFKKTLTKNIKSTFIQRKISQYIMDFYDDKKRMHQCIQEGLQEDAQKNQILLSQ